MPGQGRVAIGQTLVGEECPVYVVAEAGVNHNGRLETALRMVDAAADAGANAVKFQLFRAKALTTSGVSMATYQAKRTADSSQQTMLSRLELETEEFERIADHCRQRGITFLATPFSPNDVDRLMALGAPAIKIASTDVVDVWLLERAARAQVPLIVSTGASREDEIAESLKLLKDKGARDRLILLHCVSAYPTPMEQANLRAIATLRERFGVATGYSDHTLATTTGALAVCFGACILEKHFTLDRSAPGPDHAMSLDPPNLEEYVRAAREAQAALGTGDLDVQAVEEEVRELARKSVVPTRNIAAGEVLTAEMLAMKRAGRGIPPTEVGSLLGRRADRPITADQPLTWEMVQ